MQTLSRTGFTPGDAGTVGSMGIPYAQVARRPLHDVVAAWRPDEKVQKVQIQKKLPKPVMTTIQRVDKFIGGFPAGSMSMLASRSEFLFNLVARVIVNTVSTTERDVIYIDGGNSLDPYLLTAACRLFRLDADSILRKVQVARAFTVFQLDTLITRNLERILDQHRPRLVLVACFSELFLDRDVNWYEAKTLFETDFQKLQALTERYNVTTLLTNFGRDKSVHRFELDRQLRKWLTPEHRLSIRSPSGRKLRLVKGTGEFMDYLPLPPYQWSLDDFTPGGELCG
jgi:hypothetical protein